MTDQQLREHFGTLLHKYLHRDGIYTDEEFFNQILKLVKEAGYVKLAEDQSKPINHWGNDYGIAQHDMEVIGFRKVQL